MSAYTLESIKELEKPHVTLVGEDGNAFVILGAVSKACRHAKWPRQAIDTLTTEMTNGDYNHLLQTAMRYCVVD